jgi:pimeloyl-ACP methyl ester carboxylesterase
MKHVTTKDGTRIAYEKTGNGPGLIIIGGALGDHRFYTELTRHFTVYNFDRRGRGQSEDTQPYASERELEDLTALIDQASEPVRVYEHSAGSAFAIRAAAAGLSIAKLVLADPPFRPPDDDETTRVRHAEAAATVQALHDEGDHRGNAARFLSGFGLPAAAVEEMLDSPAGSMMIDSARALPHDYAMVGDGRVPTELAARIATPP